MTRVRAAWALAGFLTLASGAVMAWWATMEREELMSVGGATVVHRRDVLAFVDRWELVPDGNARAIVLPGSPTTASTGRDVVVLAIDEPPTSCVVALEPFVFRGCSPAPGPPATQQLWHGERYIERRAREWIRELDLATGVERWRAVTDGVPYFAGGELWIVDDEEISRAWIDRVGPNGLERLTPPDLLDAQIDEDGPVWIDGEARLHVGWGVVAEVLPLASVVAGVDTLRCGQWRLLRLFHPHRIGEEPPTHELAVDRTTLAASPLSSRVLLAFSRDQHALGWGRTWPTDSSYELRCEEDATIVVGRRRFAPDGTPLEGVEAVPR